MSDSMAAAQCVRALESTPDAKKATVYLSDKRVVSVCRRFKFSKRNRLNDFVLKIGVPNYLGRDFIKACKKAHEPLPVKRVQLRFWPKKKAA